MKSENNYRTAVVISGENPEMAIGEIKAILEIYDISYSIEVDGLLVVIDTKQPIINFIKKRSVLSIHVAELIFVSRSLMGIEESLKQFNYNFLIDSTFAVRVLKLSKDVNINSEFIERKIGQIIKENSKAHVNLTNPNHLFMLVVSKKFYLLLNPQKTIRKHFYHDKMSRLPCPHPSVMNSILSVVMINLARTPDNGLLCDPFCGVGGIGARAIKLGLKFIGIDIMYNMVSCAMKNIGAHANVSIIQGNSQNFPLEKVSHVVADLPYGRSSSTKRKDPLMLFENFIRELSLYLSENGFACIVFSANILQDAFLNKILNKQSIKLIENYFVYVHKGLVRRVMVFRK